MQAKCCSHLQVALYRHTGHWMSKLALRVFQNSGTTGLGQCWLQAVPCWFACFGRATLLRKMGSSHVLTLNMVDSQAWPGFMKIVTRTHLPELRHSAVPTRMPQLCHACTQPAPAQPPSPRCLQFPSLTDIIFWAGKGLIALLRDDLGDNVTDRGMGLTCTEQSTPLQVLGPDLSKGLAVVCRDPMVSYGGEPMFEPQGRK